MDRDTIKAIFYFAGGVAFARFGGWGIIAFVAGAFVLTHIFERQDERDSHRAEAAR